MTGQLVVIPANEFFDRFAELSESVRRIEKTLSIHISEPPAEDRLLNKLQAADMLGCSISTIDNLRRRGEITKVNVGKAVRFKLSEIKAIVENSKCDYLSE